ncbi:MAG: hypothetical protein BWY52_00428 [Chloroflexi bacterium ADurb.Bin325]|nr:MAG: hypothetical protein BWY52_00428 [Chloroflexi bacterium ADurb.Bin325]
MFKKIAAVVGVVALITALGITAVGTAFAQDETPSAKTTPTTPTRSQHNLGGRGFGFFGGGSTAQFDKFAELLNLTPTGLFEQLHSGKTLAEIAKAQGIDLDAIQETLKAERTQAVKDKIAEAVAAGTITQEQADWMLEGIEKGYTSCGHGSGFSFGPGRGHGRGPMGGMRGKWGPDSRQSAPSTQPPGTSS